MLANRLHSSFPEDMGISTHLLRRLQRINRRLRLSVAVKILVANVVILLVGAVAGPWLDRELQVSGQSWWLLLFVVLGLGVTVVVNYALIKLALFPLLAVERAALRAASGDLTARVDTEVIDDPDIERLAGAINGMMTSLEENTREIRASRDQLQWLAERVLEAQELERKRIARELHDETAQSLATLLIYLQTVAAGLPDDALSRRPLDRGLELAQRTLDGVQTITRDLRPSLLDDLGLVPAIRWQIINRLEAAGLAVELETCGGDRRLPAAVETGLYRIAQEAFTNILKHASATRVQVQLHLESRRACLSIQDNGCGFHPAAVRSRHHARWGSMNHEDVMLRSAEASLADSLRPFGRPQGDTEVDLRIRPVGRPGDQAGVSQQGMGLVSMRERAELLGGDWRLSSAPGAGTRVEVTVPLDVIRNA